LKRQLRIALISAKDAKPTLYADSNFDGRFDETERTACSSPADIPQYECATTVFLSISQGPFASYPVRIAIVKDTSNSGKVLPASSMWVHARGIVNIDGRNMLVSYPFDPATGVLDPSFGWMGMDCNGDGKIEETSNSPEWKFANHEIVGFRVLRRYLSTQSVDCATGKVILKSLPAIEYTDIELVLGRQIKDFTFTEFSGKQRKISEFKGKYVLMDFWATWCTPCVAEIPFIRSAYEKFKASGLEIVGINHDDDLNKAKKLAKEKDISWPQATNESVKNRFHINAYPTTILLDPAGKIISLGKNNELRGQNLEKTLQRLLIQRQP
jgi:thiol-disulfide isomerase/thioredoxin